MSNPIVIGVDGSEQADDAMALGRILGAALHAPLLAVCCYGHELGMISRRVAAYEEAQREAAERCVRQALGVRDGAIAGEPRAIFTPSVARGLTETAETVGAVALVVGSSHRGAIGRAMAGSVGERLIQGAPCPVALAPRGYRGAPLSIVGVAYDGTPEADTALLGAAVMAEGSGAALRIVNVLVPPSPANPLFAVTSHGYTEILGDLRELHRDRLRRGCGRAAATHDGLQIDTELLDGDVVEELLKQTETLDVLALGSRSYGPLRRVAAGAVSIRVVRKAACPAIVFPRGIDYPEADGIEQQPISKADLDRHVGVQCRQQPALRLGSESR